MGAARARKNLWFDELAEQARKARMLVGDSPNGIELMETWAFGEDPESLLIRYTVGTVRGFVEVHWRYILLQIAPQKPSIKSPWIVGQADFVEAVMDMPEEARRHLGGKLKKLFDCVLRQRKDFDEHATLGLAGIHCFTLAWRHGLVKPPVARIAAEESGQF